MIGLSFLNETPHTLLYILEGGKFHNTHFKLRKNFEFIKFTSLKNLYTHGLQLINGGHYSDIPILLQAFKI